MLHPRPRGSASHRVRPGGRCNAGDRPLRPWSTMNQPGQGRCCRMKDDDAGVNHESAHRNRSSARSSALSLCWRPSRAWRMASALVGHDSFGPGSLSTRSRWGQADGVGQADGPGRPGWLPTPAPLRSGIAHHAPPGSSSHEFATRAIRRRYVDMVQVTMYLPGFASTAQYGLKAQAVNARKAHENGDAEQSHYRFKTAVDRR